MTDTAPQPFATVAVVGAGSMGAQIAMVVALSGRRVTVTDLEQDALARAQEGLERQMGSRVERGRLDAATVRAAWDRLTLTTDLATAVRDADLVIEAVVEKLDVKRELFARLGRLAPEQTVFASNSSSFVPSSMAPSSGRPDRFLNLHFFNPALAMRCVEVIGGPETSEGLLQRGADFVTGIGKVPVVVRREVPGFIANRILNAARDEALSLYESGVAAVSDIDAACRLALGYPMGPFELMDLTGVDIGYHTKSARYAETGDPRDRPAATVERLVAEGHLGRKTGRGFYHYGPGGEKLGEAVPPPSTSGPENAGSPA